MIYIYNTLTGKKQKIAKPGNKPLKLFVCGPTVYDYSHIGHAKTYVFFDIFVRYLKHLRRKIFYLQNITDIDDKIINRAKKEEKTPKELAGFFEKEFLKDMKALNIVSVNKYARASDFIPQIIHQAKALIKKGNAYKIKNDGYYFDLSTFPDYGKLSKRTVLQAEDSASRIDESIMKRNKGDFCLWKFPKTRINADLNADKRGKKFQIVDGEPAWDTPLGWGRPGWHIEDTAITEGFFGPQYDFHGGAVDLKFPHHEAEIAQQESASGKKPFVKTWMHAGFLLVNGQKMSKSLGNFITIKDFLSKYPAEILRFLIASCHYRSPLDYTDKIVKQTQKSLETIKEFLEKLKIVQNADKIATKSARKPVNSSNIQKGEKDFREVMDDDINTPKALAVIFDLISSFQNKIWQIKPNQAGKIARFIKEKLEILGIEIKPTKIPRKIKQLADKREGLRNNQQFIHADLLRKNIEALGYKIEDTPKGPLVSKTNN